MLDNKPHRQFFLFLTISTIDIHGAMVSTPILWAEWWRSFIIEVEQYTDDLNIFSKLFQISRRDKYILQKLLHRHQSFGKRIQFQRNLRIWFLGRLTEWGVVTLTPQNEKRKTRKPDMRVVKIISEGIFIKTIPRNSDDNDDDAKEDRNCDVDNPVHRRRCESRSVNRIHGRTTCSASLARPGHCRSCQKTSTSTSL